MDNMFNEKIASALRQSRAIVGKSQEYMSLELGVARRTIQNWEKGTSEPTIGQTLEWFKILNISPLPFLYQYIHPSMEKISAKDNDQKIRESLSLIFDDMPNEQIRQLMYLLYGDHGSSPRAVLQLITAHLQTPLKDRISHAYTIIKNYELALRKGTLTSDTHIQPDLSLLKKALSEGENAYLNDANEYTINHNSRDELL